MAYILEPTKIETVIRLKQSSLPLKEPRKDISRRHFQSFSTALMKRS